MLPRDSITRFATACTLLTGVALTTASRAALKMPFEPHGLDIDRLRILGSGWMLAIAVITCVIFQLIERFTLSGYRRAALQLVLLAAFAIAVIILVDIAAPPYPSINIRNDLM